MKSLMWFCAGMFIGEIGLRWIERALYAGIIAALLWGHWPLVVVR